MNIFRNYRQYEVIPLNTDESRLGNGKCRAEGRKVEAADGGNSTPNIRYPLSISSP